MAAPPRPSSPPSRPAPRSSGAGRRRHERRARQTPARRRGPGSLAPRSFGQGHHRELDLLAAGDVFLSDVGLQGGGRGAALQRVGLWRPRHGPVVRHHALRPDRQALGAGGTSGEHAKRQREDEGPGHWLPAALGRGTTVSSTCWRRVTFSLAMSDYKEVDAGLRYSGWGYGGPATAQ